MILSIQIRIEIMFLKAKPGRKRETDLLCRLRIKVITILNTTHFSLVKYKWWTISKTGSNKKGSHFQKIENVSSKTFFKNSHKLPKMITQFITNKKSTSLKKYLNITKSNHKKNNILINFSKRSLKNNSLQFSHKEKYQQKWICNVENTITVWVKREPYPPNSWNWELRTS